MTREFLLPDVGEGLSEAEVVEWHVAPGDAVAEDQPLVDVQTDKAIVVIPCPVDGVVGELCAAVGDTVPIGAKLAVFELDGADGASAPQLIASSPQLAREPSPAPGGAVPASPALPQAAPAVRRLARELGVDLHALTGSGPGGRILREDVEAAASRSQPPGGAVPVPQRGAHPLPPRGAVPPAGPSPEPAPPPGGAASDAPVPGRTIPMRALRRSIARTLADAWRTVPHVIDYREVDFTAIVALRARLKQDALARGDEQLAAGLSLTPLLLKVAATALGRHPLVNASLSEDEREIQLHDRYDLGVATATPEGLMVPVVRDVHRKSVHELAHEVRELLERVRRRAASPQDLAGATFTVNNYGALGIWLGTPIVTPPQVANLGLGRMQQRPVVVDGEIVARPIVALACSGDHRVLDGDTLAAFVTTVAELLEQPELLLGGLR